MICPHGDPTCPCPDGLACHYEGPDAWPEPTVGGDPSQPYRHGFQHGDELGYPVTCCPFCHEKGAWYLLREGDAVVSWSCDGHLSLVLDSLQRREPGSTRVIVKQVVVENDGSQR